MIILSKLNQKFIIKTAIHIIWIKVNGEGRHMIDFNSQGSQYVSKS